MEYIYIIIGFVILTLGADWLVNGASAMAKRLNVSDLVIGLTIVAFGTSAPELVVNLVASIEGKSDIAITNILGSNAINIYVILGFTAIIYPIQAKRQTTRKFIIPLCTISAFLVCLMTSNLVNPKGLDCQYGCITRLEGILLLAIFAFYMYMAIKDSGKNTNNMGANVTPEAEVTTDKVTTDKATTNKESTTKAEGYSIFKSAGLVILGLALLIVGGKLIVSNAVTIAKAWGVSEAVIGLTIVALGTSLPELATSVVAAIKQSPDLALGNIIGSNIFNIFFILGISACIHPLSGYANVMFDSLFAGLASIIVWISVGVTRNRSVGRFTGIIFLLIYTLYILYLINRV